MSTRNYKKSTRHDRKKQTENAYKRQNPPKSTRATGSSWSLGFGDRRFHIRSRILSLNCRRMSV